MENDKLVLAFAIFYTILLNVTIPIRRIILATCSGYNELTNKKGGSNA